MPLTRLLAVVALVSLVQLPSANADPRFAALSGPGVVAVMRHALAPGTDDPANFTLDDCGTQRNLDARGQAQARAIGAAIRAAGVTIDRVLTSQWCRCRETARLLDLAPVEDFPALNSFFRDRTRADRQTLDLRQLLFRLRPAESIVLVTHQVNIRALAGRSTASGEVLLLRIGPDRTVSVIDGVSIEPDRDGANHVQ